MTNDSPTPQALSAEEMEKFIIEIEAWYKKVTLLYEEGKFSDQYVFQKIGRRLMETGDFEKIFSFLRSLRSSLASAEKKCKELEAQLSLCREEKQALKNLKNE